MSVQRSKLSPVICVADINSQSRIRPCRFCLKGNQDLNNRAKYGSRASLKHCWHCSTLQYKKLKELCGQASLRRQNLKIKFYLISFSLFKATKEVNKVQEGRFLYPLVSNQSIQTFLSNPKYSFQIGTASKSFLERTFFFFLLNLNLMPSVENPSITICEINLR